MQPLRTKLSRLAYRSPDPSPTSSHSVTMGHSLNLSRPQFLHLENGGKSGSQN